MFAFKPCRVNKLNMQLLFNLCVPIVQDYILTIFSIQFIES